MFFESVAERCEFNLAPVVKWQKTEEVQSSRRPHGNALFFEDLFTSKRSLHKGKRNLLSPGEGYLDAQLHQTELCSSDFCTFQLQKKFDFVCSKVARALMNHSADVTIMT